MFVTEMRTARLINILKIAFDYKLFINNLVDTRDEVPQTLETASISTTKKIIGFFVLFY